MITNGKVFDRSFDVVVVGGGSAGCVVASRLSEDPDTSVCLLEAGGVDRSIWFRIPIGFGKTVPNPAYGWGFQTEPEPELLGRAIKFARGKVLGGSGSINGLVFLRGSPDDYDNWEREGARNWSYRDVLPYFKKMESAIAGADEYRGRNGPITVTVNSRPSSSAKAFVEGCESLQFSRNQDFNGERLDGVGFVPINVKGRWRHSTALAYLKPSLKRDNLSLLSKTTVTRLIFEGRRAVGLETVSEGKKIRIGARKELVLSGGAVNLPALLLASGIGPADELSALSLDVLHHLPGVGKNLQDYLHAGLVFKTRAHDSINLALTSRIKSLRMLAEWLFLKSGPVAGGAVDAALFAESEAGLPEPDLHFSLMNFFPS